MDFDKFQKINDTKWNVGAIEGADIVRTFKNPACGDDYVIYLKTDNGRIADAKFTTTGCGFGLAALAIAAEWVKGKTLQEAALITEADIEKGVDGFPPRRKEYPHKAAELFRETVRQPAA